MSESALTSPQTVDRRGFARLLGVSTRTLDRMRHDRGFPRPLTGARRKPLWSREAVGRWLRSE